MELPLGSTPAPTTEDPTWSPPSSGSPDDQYSDFRRGLRYATALSNVSTDGDGESTRRSSRSFSVKNFVPERVNVEISRRYEIDAQEIGVGGYGKVFLARDRMFKDRHVAIKKLIRQEEDENADALRKEVQIMKELDHPSICKLFETYIQDKVMFFVIEHLAGGDLCDRIMDTGKIDERVTAYIMKQVSGALAYAHSRGIAHRDMKPENICFCISDTTHNRVKVIDWGLGKHFSEARMKSSVGSAAFTAPEVLDPPEDCAGYTSACDLWSLGVTAYVTLCGKPPFYGGPIQMLRKMQEEIYPMSGAVWDGISADGKDFIASLLRANPEARLPVDRLVSHPWLNKRFVDVSPLVFSTVLTNVEEFSHAPDFLSICVASVARQLDHRSLDDIYKVFSRLDQDGDGCLGLLEMKAGFEEVFGAESQQVEEFERMFERLDLDGTGRVSYTEFCSAGIGEGSYTQEHVLWAAFKTFDIHDNGRISMEDMKQVLSNADVSEVWSQSVCEDVAAMSVVVSEDGHINFSEWLDIMRECASRHGEESPRRKNSCCSQLSAESPRRRSKEPDEALGGDGSSHQAIAYPSEGSST
mmetsp:Transcript_112975/g.252094  ORF Transcript_112975/g.252094 Transcript_112975/m.252094 type:complete len:584 (+) Transcript_112975:115-1866(+)